MITFMDSKDKVMEEANLLDSQLWHACAGTMVKMPAIDSIVFYFPQGHAEHACGNVEFRNDIRIPSYIPCRVTGIKYMAEQETDEIFAKIRLTPISHNEVEIADDGMVAKIGSDNPHKPPSFAKTLTQSDANNGGGFSVPRYCADTIFPLLDYDADPPVQTLIAKDVHGKTWEFRHIFRGTPKRHLLTTGWSNFVNAKKLVAGDSIVFLRAENEDVCVGIRRVKKGITSGGFPPGWIPYENKLMRYGNTNLNENLMNRRKVKAESVIEAANLAAIGKPFEVTFYPSASTPEFFVNASRVKAALQIPWCSGMRFKMPFETEDSMLSWFMGTICSVQAADPTRWPDSPWRILQVTWDEPELLQNLKCVNPWLVELVSNMPAIHFSPYQPSLKRLRLPQDSYFPFNGHLTMSGFRGNRLLRPNGPFGCLPNDTPVGMQGARHAQYGLSLPDLHPNQLHSSLFSLGFPPHDHAATTSTPSNSTMIPKPSNNHHMSCLLTLGSSTQTVVKSDCEKAPQLVLFGQPIVIDNQISLSSPGDTISPDRAGNSSSDENACKKGNISDESVMTFDHRSLPDCLPCESFQSKHTVEIEHCEVFIESEDVGKTLDLSLLGSYDELHTELSNMSGIEILEMLNQVIYEDVTGAVKQLSDEPFSDFAKIARRLTILRDASNDNIGARE
ncbi:auxin response factor 18-like isoform X1 [Lycium ferocissimum]|uniref:auxin response factor 18-like isoform X1 n=1 Tax=Lycium ferocissimum TaxID=112874 RepID=UPI0028157D8B|nr:auxin response factor 18-like isoform X1 [Lycium ferocissimum]